MCPPGHAHRIGTSLAKQLTLTNRPLPLGHNATVFAESDESDGFFLFKMREIASKLFFEGLKAVTLVTLDDDN